MTRTSQENKLRHLKALSTGGTGVHLHIQWRSEVYFNPVVWMLITTQWCLCHSWRALATWTRMRISLFEALIKQPGLDAMPHTPLSSPITIINSPPRSSGWGAPFPDWDPENGHRRPEDAEPNWGKKNKNISLHFRIQGTCRRMVSAQTMVPLHRTCSRLSTEFRPRYAFTCSIILQYLLIYSGMTQLENLCSCTGIYATLFIVCGHVNDTTQGTMYTSDDLEDFWEDHLHRPLVDICHQYKQWACAQGKSMWSLGKF